MQEDAERWFELILSEIKKLMNAGYIAVEAHNVNHWYLDTLGQRVLYLAPHWLAPEFKIADQIGFGCFKFEKKDPEMRLTGVSGLYVSGVLAVYNYILMRHGRATNWNDNTDRNGRVPVFVVANA